MADINDKQRMDAVLKHGFIRLQTHIPGVFKPLTTRKEFDNWLQGKPISKRWNDLPENQPRRKKKP